MGALTGGPVNGLLAHYEYDPYGNTVFSTGTMAGTNPFRFSSKWIDTELGSGREMYNFTFRIYLPRVGRWMNQDPLEESAGPNSYAYIGNSPVDGVDLLGLADPLEGLNPVVLVGEGNYLQRRSMGGYAAWWYAINKTYDPKVLFASGPAGFDRTLEARWYANLGQGEAIVQEQLSKEPPEGAMTCFMLRTAGNALPPGPAAFIDVSHAKVHHDAGDEAGSLQYLRAAGFAAATGAGGYLTGVLGRDAFGGVSIYDELRNAGRVGIRPGKSNPAINPRLIARLDAYHAYNAGGGQMSMAEWVSHTQGAPYGTGIKSGYAQWARDMEWAQSRGYTLVDRTSGEPLKYGDTTLGARRYSKRYLDFIDAWMVPGPCGTKRAMRKWAHEQILDYKAATGELPPLNFNEW